MGHGMELAWTAWDATRLWAFEWKAMVWEATKALCEGKRVWT